MVSLCTILEKVHCIICTVGFIILYIVFKYVLYVVPVYCLLFLCTVCCFCVLFVVSVSVCTVCCFSLSVCCLLFLCISVYRLHTVHCFCILYVLFSNVLYYQLQKPTVIWFLCPYPALRCTGAPSVTTGPWWSCCWRVGRTRLQWTTRDTRRASWPPAPTCTDC